MVGTFFVRLGSNMKIMQALYKGFIASAVLSAVLIGGAISTMGFDASFTLNDRR